MKCFNSFLRCFAVITLFQLCCLIKLSAQINIVWNSEYVLPSNVSQNSSQVDRLGNIYEAHISFYNPVDSLHIMKFDPEGNVIWYKLLLADNSSVNYQSIQLLIDSLNCPIVNILIDSMSSESNVFIKCDTAGVILWQTSVNHYYANPPTVIDINNNLYTQYSRNIDSTMVLEKYDSLGNIAYQASTFFYSGAWGKLPVIDGTGNAWMSYQLASPTYDTAKWFKVNPTGSIVDSLEFIGSVGPMTFDQQGNMIAGFTHQYPPNSNYTDSNKTAIRKYDASMNLLWDSGPTDLYLINETKVDNWGNTYGFSGVPNVYPNEMKVGKFDSSGNLLWIHTFGLNSGGLSNFAYAKLFLDASGNPFVVGKYYTNGFVISAPTDLFFIKRIDSNGVLMDLEIVNQQSYVAFDVIKNFGNDLFIMTGFDTLKIYKLCIDCPSTVSGTVYFDADSSCTLNGTEHGIRDAIVKILPGSLYLNTDSNGYYHAYLNDNNYDVIFAPYLNYNHSCMIDTVGIQITSGIPATNINSGNYLDAGLHDLQLNMCRGRVRPGFNTLYAINYKNGGGSVQTGTIDFVHDSVFNFVQSIPPPDLVNGDTLRWNFSGFLQGRSETISVTLNTPVTVAWGSTFINGFFINGNSPDFSPVDNVVLDTGMVTGSYDPNDKSVSPLGSGSQGYIMASDSLIKYTINFENIGNDTAFTVLVIDTLDSDLDIGSLQMGGISHLYTWDIIHSNVLRFRFDNIQLADSSHPNESSGFINFFIRQKSNLPSGTEIVNSADIYFDYNLPIKTNETLNTIFNPLSINNNAPSSEIMLSPNPVSDWLTIHSGENGFSAFTLFDINGKPKLQSVTSILEHQKNLKIDFTNFKQGIYILKLQTKESTFFKKIIKL